MLETLHSFLHAGTRTHLQGQKDGLSVGEVGGEAAGTEVLREGSKRLQDVQLDLERSSDRARVRSSTRQEHRQPN